MSADLPADVVELVQGAARTFATNLLESPSVMKPLVDQHITELVEAGDLVPRQRLQVGVGLELAPPGLQRAARELLRALARSKLQMTDELSQALDHLEGVLDGRPETAAEPEPVAEDDAEEEPEGEPEVSAEAPAESATLHCAVCDVEIDAEQALVSQTRWRKPLCPTHHETGGKPEKPDKEENSDA